MAHYAFLDSNNIVTQVITGVDEDFDGGNWEARYAEAMGQPCKRTSYNTLGGVHREGKTPLRKNYAGVGYRYDENLDAFIPPQPFPSWSLNEDTCCWEPPIPAPINAGSPHVWDEEQATWVAL